MEDTTDQATVGVNPGQAQEGGQPSIVPKQENTAVGVDINNVLAVNDVQSGKAGQQMSTPEGVTSSGIAGNQVNSGQTQDGNQTAQQLSANQVNGVNQPQALSQNNEVQAILQQNIAQANVDTQSGVLNLPANTALPQQPIPTSQAPAGGAYISEKPPVLQLAEQQSAAQLNPSGIVGGGIKIRNAQNVGGGVAGLQATDTLVMPQGVEPKQVDTAQTLGGIPASEAGIPSQGAGAEGQAPQYEMPQSHPLYGLYSDLEQHAVGSELMLQQEIEAQKQHKTIDQLRQEAEGWKTAGGVAVVIMILSWLMVGGTIFYAMRMANAAGERSVSFILLVITLMMLLSGVILSIWVKTKKIFKTLTLFCFIVFICLFVLVELKAANIFKLDFPIIDTLVDNLMF